MRTNCGPNFSFIAPILRKLWPKNLQNWAQLGQLPPPKKGYLQSKVEDDKYPEVKLCGFINYGWKVLL